MIPVLKTLIHSKEFFTDPPVLMLSKICSPVDIWYN